MGHQDWLNHRGYRDESQRCDGELVFTAQDGPIWEVCCTTCGFTAGLPATQVSGPERHRMAVARSELPAAFIGKEFEKTNSTEPARDALRGWVRDYASAPTPAPALYGPNGVGKTHLLVAACEQLIRMHNTNVWFQPIAAFLDRLMAAFEQRGEHARLWDRVTTVDVLALDDVGAEQVTDWRAERLARIVDERYQHGRPIVLATNVPPNAWDEILDPRTVSRLRGMTTPVAIGGTDRRMAA